MSVRQVLMSAALVFRLYVIRHLYISQPLKGKFYFYEENSNGFYVRTVEEPLRRLARPVCSEGSGNKKLLRLDFFAGFI